MNAPVRLRPVPAFLASLALLAGFATLAGAGMARRPPVPSAGRVIVLGFDGADARTTRRLIDEGALPNLARLAETGTFAPLVSTNPAESAAGWAALNTGTNPLKNNIPSFIKRTTSGPVSATFGHIRQETVPIGEFEHRWPMGPLVRYGVLKVSALLGVVVVFFLALFKLLLRVNAAISAVLSLLLGGFGGWSFQRWVGELPDDVPGVYRNLVTQKGFWDYAAQHGKRALVLDAALAFDQEHTPGARVLGGLGLPDIRGASNGNWFIYTTDPLMFERAPQGRSSKGSGTGTTFRVDERDGRVETKLYGPVDFVERSRLMRQIARLTEKLEESGLGWKKGQALRDQRKEAEQILKEMGWMPDGERGGRGYGAKEDEHRATLDMQLERRGDRLAVTIAGRTQTVGEGEWTDWFHLPFELGNLVTAHAITRARLISLEDPLEVYLNTFDIDPRDPPFWQPVTQPEEFSATLADWIGGPYETLGWSCMTNQIKDKSLPVDLFLEDIEFTMGWRKELTLTALERDDWDVLFSVFSTTDRVQHMMYRYHDPLHPRHDPQEAARQVVFFGEPTALADVIPAIYRQMDVIVGEVLAKLGPDDTLLLCADHGFTSYRRGMEINNWMAENGYLTLRSDLTSTRDGTLYSGVDWSQTRAYALGLGMVYVNMAGREPEGIVPREEAKALLQEIGEKLLLAEDPGPTDEPYEDPVRVVRDYAIMDDLYQGPGTWGDRGWPCADMQIGFEEFYRASWGSVTGKIRLKKDDGGGVVLGSTYRNNTNNWSGDHASNSPQVVTGIFFSSRPVELPEEGVSVMHLAPTVLAACGVPIPEHFDRPPLEFR